MSDKSDAKQTLKAAPWRTGGDHRDAPVDEEYPAEPGIIEPLPEWSNWRGSESSTLENDVYVWRYTLTVVHARNEWMNKWMNKTEYLNFVCTTMNVCNLDIYFSN